MTKTIRTATLEIAYEESGPAAGRPVILLHGFPDDVHAYDGVAPPLAARGWRVFAPYLRGYGLTRFLDAGTPRSGQQAALGRDLADFMDALGWSGRFSPDTIGRARRLYRRGVVAAARHRTGHGRRL